PPVPVPPPSPAVTKTMSAPRRTSSISSAWSSAARLPTSGPAPAPRPRVISLPTSSLTSASDISSAWASVLIAMHSTPLGPDSIMRLTALTPPPPTPTTLMTASEIWVPATFGSLLLSFLRREGPASHLVVDFRNPRPRVEVRTSGRLCSPLTLGTGASARKYKGRVSAPEGGVDHRGAADGRPGDGRPTGQRVTGA